MHNTFERSPEESYYELLDTIPVATEKLGESENISAVDELRNLCSLFEGYKATNDIVFINKAQEYLQVWSEKYSPSTESPENQISLDQRYFSWVFMETLDCWEALPPEGKEAVVILAKKVAQEEEKFWENDLYHDNRFAYSNLTRITAYGILQANDEPEASLQLSKAISDFYTHVNENVDDEGRSMDFIEHDSVGYHVFNQIAWETSRRFLLEHAIAIPEDITSKLDVSLDYAMFYINPENIHLEFVDSKLEEDRETQGLKVGKPFNRSSDIAKQLITITESEVQDPMDALKEYNEWISAQKERFPKLHIIEVTEDSYAACHKALAENVKLQALFSVDKRLSAITEEEFVTKFETASQALTRFLESYVNNVDFPKKYRDLTKEYYDSLTVWSNTIDFSSLENKKVKTIMETKQLSQEELNLVIGFMLQDEAVGCQSAMLWEGDTVKFLHTEEWIEDEPGERIDKSRILKTIVNTDKGPEEKFAFIYPDLLPGPACCWGKDWFLSMDSQRAAENNETTDLPINLVSWIVWRLGKEGDVDEVVRTFSPYTAGCILNSVRVKETTEGRTIDARSIDFAYDKVSSFELPKEVKSSTNDAVMVSQNVPHKGSSLFEIDDPDYEKNAKDWYLYQAQRPLRLIEKYRNSGNKVDLEFLRRMLGSGGGNAEWGMGYANWSTVAHFVGSISLTETEIIAGPGPSDKSDAEENKLLHVKL